MDALMTIKKNPNNRASVNTVALRGDWLESEDYKEYRTCGTVI